MFCERIAIFQSHRLVSLLNSSSSIPTWIARCFSSSFTAFFLNCTPIEYMLVLSHSQPQSSLYYICYTLSIALFPTIYFFTFLYYTDSLSLLLVMTSYLFALYSHGGTKIIILYKFPRRERTICLFVGLLRIVVHFHETNQHCVVLFHWRHHSLSTSIPFLLHSFHSTITTGTPVVPLEHSFKPSSNNSLQTYGLL